MTPTFEITIQRCLEFDVFPVVAELSTPGDALPQRTEGRITLSAADLEELGTKVRPLDYGKYIGGLLFHGEILRAFDRAATRADSRMNVLLAIEAPELRALHWEWLCVPIDGAMRPIAQEQRFPFCLFQPSQVDRRFPPFGHRDLRMLVVVASPRGLEKYSLDPFDEARALQSVSEAVSGKISYDVLSCSEDLPKRTGPATLPKLCERLTEKRYTLLHIIAHGRYGRDGETILYLGNEQGDVQAVPAKELLTRLGQLGALPHFVFLAVCESARPEAEAAMGGLGQRLVRELGTPAVLAMTRKVSHFLAYELARRLYPQLVEHGYVERALVESCAGLAGQADVSVPALYSRLGGRPLWSDDLAGRELTPQEIEYGLDRTLELFADRSPVLLPRLLPLANKTRSTLGLPPRTVLEPAAGRAAKLGGGKFRSTARVMYGASAGATDNAQKLRLRSETPLTDPATLSKEARQEFLRTMSELETLCVQVLDLGFSAVALDKRVQAYAALCPFPGMRAFAEDDQRYFFGREALVTSLLRRIHEHPFLAVLGASGSGKSSVVRAGLLPRLRREIANLHCVTMIPGADPYTQLESALERAGVEDPTRAEAGRQVVLFVDQFEEVFTLCPREKRSLFLQRLLRLLPGMKIVLTMRADFWGECAEYAALRRLMQEHQELVASMTPHELRSAIEQQARAAGLRFEPTLCEKIVEQVQSEPGAMPLLQHALLKLWERRHGTWLSFAEYDAIGGVQRAIAETADSIYNALEEEDRARMRTVFVRLTRVDENTTSGESRRDTRQRVAKADLMPAGVDSSPYLALIAHLADARLLVTSVSPSTQQEEVEVVHESLIRNWPRLQSWLEEQRDSLALREALSKAAQDWKKRRRNPQWLVHSGSRLRECDEIQARFPGLLNQLEQEYLNTCRTQVKRTRFAWGAVLFGLSTSVFGIAGLLLSQRSAHVRQGSKLVQAKQVTEWEQGRRQGSLAMLLAQEPGTRLRALDQGLLAVAPFLKHKTAAPGGALGGLLVGLSVASFVAPLIPAHAGAANAVVISPDGTLLASAGTDKQIRLFDLQSGVLRRSIGIAPAVCNALIFSPKGDRLYAALTDGTVRSYEPLSRAREETLVAGGAAVVALALSADGRWIAVGADDGSIRVHDLMADKPKDTLLRQRGGVRALAFSADATKLVSGDEDGSLHFWNLSTRHRTPKTVLAHHSAVNALLIVPHTTTVFSGGEDREVHAWNIADGRSLGSGLAITAPVTTLALGPGERLAVGDNEGTTTVFRLGVRAPLWSIKDEAHEKPVAAITGLAFTSDPNRLVTASRDGFLRVLNLPRSPPLLYLPDHDAAITMLAWSPDGSYVLTAAADRSFRLYDMARGRTLHTLQHLDESVVAAQFTSLGEVMVLTRKGTLRRYHVGLGTLLTTTALPVSRVATAQIDQAGHRILVSEGNTTFLFDLQSGAKLHEIPCSQLVQTVALSMDGKLAAIGSADEVIRLYDLDSGSLLRSLDAPGGALMQLRFSNDGKLLLSGGSNQPARLWNLQNGKPVVIPSNHSYKQVALGFMQDGQRAMIGSAHGIVTMHDLTGEAKDDQPLLYLRTRHALLRNAVLSPDGKQIMTGGNDGSVHVFLIDTALLWQYGCETLLSAVRPEDDVVAVFEQARAECASPSKVTAPPLGSSKPLLK